MIRKILVMELWGIGDVIMMTSVLKPLRAEFPQAEICVLAQEYGRQVLLNNENVSRVFVFKFPWTAFSGKYCFWRWDWKGLSQILASLRREKFDLVLDGRGDPRNGFLAWLIGPRRFLGARKTKEMPHRVDHWGSLLKRLGIVSEDLRPLISLRVEEFLEAKKFLEGKFPVKPRRLVGIHPGAAQKVRCWPMARFKDLAGQLKDDPDAGVLVLVEPDGYGQDMALSLGLPSFQGSVRQLMAVVAQLDLLVCNDTGVMHMADALKIPLVAVFGPGSPALIGPRDKSSQIVIKECPRRPCFDHCRYPGRSCLEDIAVQDVLHVVKNIIHAPHQLR